MTTITILKATVMVTHNASGTVDASVFFHDDICGLGCFNLEPELAAKAIGQAFLTAAGGAK